MDLNKLRKTLEIFFEYAHRTIGTFIAVAAFWMYFTGSLSDKKFWIGLGAAVALGFFGPRANISFFRGRVKQQEKTETENNEPTNTEQ